MQFKTNLKCDGCVAKVTPYLNELTDKWAVDAAKVLTVDAGLEAEAVVKAVERAGYKAEVL